MKSEKVVGYRQEKNVDKNSPVETFAAVKFFVDTGAGKMFRFMYVRVNICMKKRR